MYPDDFAGKVVAGMVHPVRSCGFGAEFCRIVEDGKTYFGKNL